MRPRTTWQTVYLVAFVLALVLVALLFYESSLAMISDRYRVEPPVEPVLPEVLLTVTPRHFIQYGAEPPATCLVGAIFLDTDSTDGNERCLAVEEDNYTLCLCIATDTWVGVP